MGCDGFRGGVAWLVVPVLFMVASLVLAVSLFLMEAASESYEAASREASAQVG